VLKFSEVKKEIDRSNQLKMIGVTKERKDLLFLTLIVRRNVVPVNRPFDPLQF
jgi:hypothetical protein